MERIYVIGQMADIKFNWTSIPAGNIPTTMEPFNRIEMNTMYQVGYEQGLRGGDWRNRPPELGQKLIYKRG